VCHRYGVPVTADDAVRAEPAVWRRIARRDDAGRGYSVSRERSREFWLWVYRAFLEEAGHPEAAVGDLPQRLLEAFIQLEAYRLYDDALPTLRQLRDAGLTLGVISNWEDWLERLMVSLGIATHFDVVAISGVCGVEKPDSAIFRQALAAAGVTPSEALHVGDSLRDDVEGAEAVGMRGILLERATAGVVRYADPGAPESRTRIATLLEIPSLIGLEPNRG
jgi:REG-2-like HAD superfamily hydrolase